MSEAAGPGRTRLRQAVGEARRGRLDLAREALERAVEEEPTSREAFALLAAVHLEQGDAGLARAALEEAGVDEAAARAALDEARSVMTPDDLAQALDIGRPGGGMKIVSDRLLSVPAGPTSHARLAAALVWDGQVVCQPAPRRRKGQVDAPDDEWTMVQVGGTGRIVLAPGGKPVVLELRDEGVFLREGAVDAFEGPLVFENGRVPGGGPRFVHLSGRGRVALRPRGRLCALRLSAGERAQLPLDALEGFFGGLFVRAVSQAGGAPTTAACEGEGTLLLRTPD
jgi:hypothetical protein